MTNFSKRIQLIYIPYLVLSLSFIIIYSVLDWLFIMHLELPLNEEVVHYWLVIGIPWLPVFIWLRPRIRLLRLKDKKGNLPFLYQFVAIIAMAVPCIIAQDYLVTATGKLTILQNISAINRQPLTKYYELKNYSIDKRNIAIYKRAAVSSKNNEYFTMYIDVACPVLDSRTAIDSVDLPKAWLCLEFSKQISNHGSDKEKESEFHSFDTIANNEYKEKDLNNFVYLDRIAFSDKQKAYVKAIKSKVNISSKPIIFEAVSAPFEERNGEKLPWIFGSFGIGALIFFLMIIIPKINEVEMEKYEGENIPSEWTNFYKSIIKLKISQSNCAATFIIIGLNILIFIVMVFAGLGFISFDGRDLLQWGANFRPMTTDGEWWRLVTNIFLHGGLMHLLMNMYGLFFVAIFLEPLLGRVKYVTAYLICGITASVASIWWHPATISIGASGAIFGLYGIWAALLTTRNVAITGGKGVVLICLSFIVLNLFIGLMGGGIDNAAHIGGLLCGILIGYLFYFFADLPRIDEQE